MASLFDCISNTCTKADAVGRLLTDAQRNANTLAAKLAHDASAFDCIINGAAGQTCTLSGGNTLPTLAEQLTRVNATTITALADDKFTATAGQTVFTLAAAVAGPAYVEVTLNGALQADGWDYTVAGDQLTFLDPLEAGDLVYARRFEL